MSLGTVVLVTPHFPPHLGGVEQYVSHLATGLLQSGAVQRAVVVTTTPDGPQDRAMHPGLVVHRLPTSFTVSNTPVGIGWVSALRAVIEQERPDVVNGHAPVPLLADAAARAAGDVPFVLTYHTGPMRKGRPLSDAVLRCYESTVLRRTASRAAAVVCGSTYVHESMRHVLGPRARIISAGVDTGVFRPGTGDDDLARRRPRVLFVGSLYEATRYKGLDTLVEAVRALRASGLPVHLDVVGDGDARASYERQCAELGLTSHVTFHGSLDRAEVAHAYRQATVVALPSRFDSIPTALVEAMASGVPVVASSVGGIPELVHDGRTGVLVPPADPAGLAAGLARVLTDARLAADLAATGRAHVEEHLAWTVQARRTAEVFEQAVAGARPRHRFGLRSAARATDPAGRPAGSGTAAFTTTALAATVGAACLAAAAPAAGATRCPERSGARTRVAVVTPYYAPRSGGVEEYTRTVTAALAATDDLDTVVVTTRPGLRTTVDEVDGTPVVRLGAWWRLSNTPISPLWPFQLRRVLRRWDVDVVNAHSPVPLFADCALLAAGRRPVVLTYHSGTLVKGSRFDPLLRAYERFALPRLFARAAALVAVSPASLAWATGRAELITPGVDTTVFTPRRGGGAPATDPAGARPLLYVGRLERTSSWKGVHVLVEALARLLDREPSARLEIVGDGDLRADLEALAERLGVAGAVRFRGVLHGAALVEAYRGAAVTVLPSLTAAESFGMVLVESMACGTPVVASRVGGIPFVVRDRTDGLLVPPGDATALAAACAELLDDPEAGRRMGAAGRAAAVERFSWPASTGRTSELLRAVAAGRDDGLRPDGAR